MKTGREMPRNFGEKLRFYREEKKYSLKDVQRMTGVDAGYISKLEKKLGVHQVSPLSISSLLRSILVFLI
ncbi:helix-turn-helix domain-containing protein [Gracilibacillus boraciitolerans]|uniref:helix-turn-helix domain-containing protein n=1 Tax=Gracilibacillus boraciitolerans TaxID=307521 RepID=UPI000558B6C1|nr:helix-turn-helix transcriptional regulator [Gracilibacillus boraciitolerans]